MSTRQNGGPGKKQDGGTHGSAHGNIGLQENSAKEQQKKGRVQSVSTAGRSRSSSRDNSVTCPRTASPSAENVWSCDSCDTDFNDPNDKLLTCEYCGNHRCAGCLGLTKSVYKAISGRTDLPWFCNDCIEKSLVSIRQTKTIEDRCEDFLTEFETRMDKRMSKIEQELLSVKEGIGSMRSDIVKQVTDEIPITQTEGVEPLCSQAVEKETIVKNATDEMQARMDRIHNVVLFNVQEGTGNLKDELRKQDITEIVHIEQVIGVDVVDSDVITVRRLGKKDLVKKVHGEETSVPRPLLATFTETVKSLIMKNAYKLQFADSDYIKKVGLKHDMSRDERQREGELRKEAKKKQEEADNEDFLFLVRGPPWERKIVKVRKTAREGRLPAA